MSKRLLLQAGYNLEYTTYENDGDHYNTETINFGENKQKVLIFADILEKIYNEQEVSNEKILNYLKENNILDYQKNNTFSDDYTEEDIEELLYEFDDKYGAYIGYQYENNFHRICESFTILYSPINVYVSIIEI